MTIDSLKNIPLLFNRLDVEALPEVDQQTIASIDAILPQTQCGLCDHPDGCFPYAVAIVVENELHNKCVPGGQPVSDAIANLLERPKLTARESQWPVNPITQRPTEVRAIIREDDCIGCTKCIPACPVDAIIGTGKHMHSIIVDLCTGCELCLPPCPVDCIDLVKMPRTMEADSSTYRSNEQAHLRQRYHNHLNRVAQQMADSTHAKPVTSMVESQIGNVAHKSININEADAKSTIKAAKLRTKIKKLEKQLNLRDSPKKRQELLDLQHQLSQIK